MNFRYIFLLMLITIIVSCTLFAKDQDNYYENAKDIRNTNDNDPQVGKTSAFNKPDSIWGLN